jgi:hypothetical protein
MISVRPVHDQCWWKEKRNVFRCADLQRWHPVLLDGQPPHVGSELLLFGSRPLHVTEVESLEDAMN